MKKILRGLTVYRIKCPHCDCEFEYDYSEVTKYQFGGGWYRHMKVVQCPECKSFLDHKDSVSTSTETIMEDTMTT